jgi:hypothetical protein
MRTATKLTAALLLAVTGTTVAVDATGVDVPRIEASETGERAAPDDAVKPGSPTGAGPLMGDSPQQADADESVEVGSGRTAAGHTGPAAPRSGGGEAEVSPAPPDEHAFFEVVPAGEGDAATVSPLLPVGATGDVGRGGPGAMTGGATPTASGGGEAAIHRREVLLPRELLIDQARTLLGSMEIHLDTFGPKHGWAASTNWHRDGSYLEIPGLPGFGRRDIEIPEQEPFKFPGIERYLKHYLDRVTSEHVRVIPRNPKQRLFDLEVSFAEHGREIRGRCIRRIWDITKGAYSWNTCADMERDIELRGARLLAPVDVAVRDRTLTLVPRDPQFLFGLQIKNWNCTATGLGKQICNHITNRIQPQLRSAVEAEVTREFAALQDQVTAALRPLVQLHIHNELSTWVPGVYTDGVPWDVVLAYHVNDVIVLRIERPAPDPGPTQLRDVDLQLFLGIEPYDGRPVERACPVQLTLEGTLVSTGGSGEVRYRYRWASGALSTEFVQKLDTSTRVGHHDSRGVLSHYTTGLSQVVSIPLPPAGGGTGDGPGGGGHLAGTGALQNGIHTDEVRIEITGGPVSDWRPYHLECVA